MPSDLTSPTEAWHLDYRQASPEAVRAQATLERFVRGCGLEHSLLHLVKIRASQVNGCGYCIDMHTREARAAGETEQRIYLLNAWREAPFYTPRERAALAWTEVVTAISEGGPNDALHEEMRQHFTDEELVNLTMAVITINAWNRLSISFKTPVGSYQPKPS